VIELVRLMLSGRDAGSAVPVSLNGKRTEAVASPLAVFAR
jgi:hypothetical protein